MGIVTYDITGWTNGMKRSILIAHLMATIGALAYIARRAVNAAFETRDHAALTKHSWMTAEKNLAFPRFYRGESVALQKFNFQTGDVILFTYNTGIRFLTNSPYSHVGLVVDNGAMLFHTTPHPPYVPRCEPVLKALSRTLASKRTFRRCRVDVRRITMPNDVRERANLMLGKFVREHHNHKHTYSGTALVMDLARELLCKRESNSEKYCSGLIATALRHCGILKRWHCSAVLPCHFGPELEHQSLVFTKGCALWPPVSVVAGW